MVRDEKKKKEKAEVVVQEKIIFTDPQLQILNNKIDWIAERVAQLTREDSNEEEEDDE